MNLYSRLFLVSCLLTSVMYGQQRFFLDKNNVVVRDSEDLNLEHALFDYHHYYAQGCERSWFDFQAAPFYTHLKTISSDVVDAYPELYNEIDPRATNQFGGAQFQAQLNICDFYIRANTQVANVKSSFGDCGKYPDKYPDKKDDKNSFTGVDDVTLKAGYDWFFCNEDHHAGIYMLGGFPVNNRDAVIYPTRAEFLAGFPTLDNDVRLGVYSYRVGAGFNAAFTLYNCDDSRLTWHADAQYAYAFPRTVAEIKGALYPENNVTKVKYTPGQFVSGWTALHYANCGWNFELGSMFETMFSEKVSVDNEGTAKETLSTLTLVEKPGRTIEFLAKPYVAAAYNTTVCEYPLTLGLGVGYEYDKVHDLHTFDATTYKDVEIENRLYDSFQGVNVWGNITMSF